jgi:hypothetical protein
MNSNNKPTLLSDSDISLRNGGLPFVGTDAFHRKALWSTRVRPSNGSSHRSDIRRVARKLLPGLRPHTSRHRQSYPAILPL